MSAYYRITWDQDFPNPWWLGELNGEVAGFDCRVFTDGVPQVVTGPLRVPIREAGEALKLTFSAFDVPIIALPLGDMLAKFAPGAIQRFPVKVGDVAGAYEVLNVTQTVDAVDRDRAGYLLWKPEDGRPDKVGTFLQIHHMVFQRDIHPPPHIFRVKNWEIALVVSKSLMEALRAENLRGIKFHPIEQ